MKVIKRKEDWIKEGFELLKEKGISSVKVEPLARRLGLTKGSFYGYFVNRDAFLLEMLDYWELNLTKDVIDQVLNLDGSLCTKLLKILSIVEVHEHKPLDKSMVCWSFSDERAKVVVNRVVRKRIDFMKGLFVEGGFSDDHAELRARLMHSFVHGDRSFPLTCEASGSKERQIIIQNFIELICAPETK